MKKHLSPTSRLYVTLVIGTAAILLVALGIASVLEYTFVYLGHIVLLESGKSGWHWVLIFSATSILIGLVLAFLLGKIIFKPIDTIIKGMTKLAGGDFSTRIDLGKYDGLKNLTTSFNALATELQNTEILRSDFINDFSHELKTPIVSISGLIPLLKNENLSEEKRRHYLAIMEEEANRLTKMTSNALYLSKIEKQAILTNTTSYNVSEQIRNSLLLLERKWEQKELEPVIDLEEFTITANEDMMKEVWLNLIDNAIKFADEGSELKISATPDENYLNISIENSGNEIPENELDAIFTKFYQADKSRASEGNGIGLSIVKHILNLHNGKISVTSKNRTTVFTVGLKL